MKIKNNELSLQLPEIIAIKHPVAQAQGISLSILDISAMHAQASGNKLFKLNLNLEYAVEQGFTHVLSFGGAYSNHIHALAAYAPLVHPKGLKTIGIIRGEPEYANNPTLKAAQECGMQLHLVDRQTYRLRNDAAYLETLAQQYPHALIIPEGGSNQLAVEGCMQLAQILNEQMAEAVDTVAVPCGTGGTLAGLVCGLEPEQQVLGFSVVRDDSLPERIDHLLRNIKSTQTQTQTQTNYQLIAADYGGYAKFDKTHLDFILQWLEQTGILLDPIYTSKMCRKLLQLIENKELPEGRHICMIHTGGLQAWCGMQDRVITLGGDGAWAQIKKDYTCRQLLNSY